MTSEQTGPSGGASASPGLAIDRTAPTERIPLGDGTSWVDRSAGFVVDPVGLLDACRAGLAWTQAEVLRYDRYVPERRLTAAVPTTSSIVALTQMGLHLDARYRVRFGAPGALLYRDGRDFQGLHSDREMRWLDETLVAIVVLGARRPFVLRPRADTVSRADRTPAGRAEGDVVLRPGHGELIVLGGRCQRDWLHGVPEATGAGPRLSLMWRWTSRRGRPDTNPGYFDGRQFSDAPRRRGYRTRPVR
ncbi:MAG: DNA repair protein [Acidimicrobiia bacterium]|nr:DNA repair protein [Acidimicrobiia bacterium]